MLLILTGKTAAGKDTVMFRLLSKFPDFRRIVTTTSRPLRAGEQEGRDYYFIPEPEFRNKINRGDFIEYVEYAGNLYGTEKSQLISNKENDLIWRIDPSRAGEIRKFIKDAFDQDTASGLLKKVLVVYLTTDDQVVLARLQKRGLSQQEIEKRMSEDKQHWEKYQDNYDFVVENIPGNLEATIDKIVNIIGNHHL